MSGPRLTLNVCTLTSCGHEQSVAHEGRGAPLGLGLNWQLYVVVALGSGALWGEGG